MKNKKTFLLSLVAISAILICDFLLFWSPSSNPNAQTWNGITPGETTLAQALAKLGPRKEFQSRDGCIRLSYLIDPFAPEYIKGWGEINILLKPLAGNFVVVLIHRTDLQITPPNNPYLLEEGDLKFWAMANRRPDKVTWSRLRHFRVLIWARQGMAITAFSTNPQTSWNDQILAKAVVEIILFEPIDLQQLLKPDLGNGEEFTVAYPCASLLDVRSLPSNTKPPSSVIKDPFPQDPYDWENLPTPPTTESP
jgi:hypothetical protein